MPIVFPPHFAMPPRCRSGYYGVGPVCWAYCGSGYTDIGALCHRGTHDYGKSCCHYGTTGCRKKKWGVCWSYHWVSSFLVCMVLK
jgi:hypothetical protein